MPPAPSRPDWIGRSETRAERADSFLTLAPDAEADHGPDHDGPICAARMQAAMMQAAMMGMAMMRAATGRTVTGRTVTVCAVTGYAR